MKSIGRERMERPRRSAKLPREAAASAPPNGRSPKGRDAETRGALHAVPAAGRIAARDWPGPVSSRFQSLVANAKRTGGGQGSAYADLRRDYDNALALLKRRESELRERTRLFRAVFDQTFQFIGLLAPDGTMLEVNQSALSFGGLTATDVVGKPFWDTRWWSVSEKTRHDVKESVRRAAQGEFIRYEVAVRGAGDLLRTVDFSIKPVFDENGQVTLLIPEGRDVSERARTNEALRRSEMRLAKAQQIAKLGHWEWDPTTNAIYWSEGVYRIFGLQPSTFGASYDAFFNIVHPDDREDVRKALEDAVQGIAPYNLDHRIQLSDGTVRTVHEQAEVMFDDDGCATRMIGMVQDITDRKREEEALRLAKEQAEIANRAKTQFLANMSHELRTPLNAIIGFSEMILREALGPVGNEKYKDYIGSVLESGQLLLGVINDILDMSKIEAGRAEPDLADFPVEDAMEAVRRVLSERAVAARLRLTTKIEPNLPWLRADERMVKQILLNLLSNAIKFTREGGEVTLGAALDSGDGIVLSVQDTGIGIAAENLAKALEPFGQIDGSLNRRYSGTGLGLPLVKAMTELHGGTLEIDSEVGVGTKISVKFPPSSSIRPGDYDDPMLHEPSESL